VFALGPHGHHASGNGTKLGNVSFSRCSPQHVLIQQHVSWQWQECVCARLCICAGAACESLAHTYARHCRCCLRPCEPCTTRYCTYCFACPPRRPHLELSSEHTGANYRACARPARLSVNVLEDMNLLSADYFIDNMTSYTAAWAARPRKMPRALTMCAQCGSTNTEGVVYRTSWWPSLRAGALSDLPKGHVIKDDGASQQTVAISRPAYNPDNVDYS
jgi:hypothetical protein